MMGVFIVVIVLINNYSFCTKPVHKSSHTATGAAPLRIPMNPTDRTDVMPTAVPLGRRPAFR
jgi:hypothetical protein